MACDRTFKFIFIKSTNSEGLSGTDTSQVIGLGSFCQIVAPQLDAKGVPPGTAVLTGWGFPRFSPEERKRSRVYKDMNAAPMSPECAPARHVRYHGSGTGSHLLFASV